jgi:hypothetical protein
MEMTGSAFTAFRQAPSGRHAPFNFLIEHWDDWWVDGQPPT